MSAKKSNIIPNSERTPQQRKEIARAGGIASGKARREKADLRKCLEVLLEKESTDASGKKATGADLLCIKLFQQAMKGNTKAFEIIRDTVGQKPVDRIEQTAKVVDMSQYTTAQIKEMLDDDIS